LIVVIVVLFVVREPIGYFEKLALAQTSKIIFIFYHIKKNNNKGLFYKRKFKKEKKKQK
jgi:hypothetical protein